jgi:hypothetical protein
VRIIIELVRLHAKRLLLYLLQRDGYITFYLDTVDANAVLTDEFNLVLRLLLVLRSSGVKGETACVCKPLALRSSAAVLQVQRQGS